MQPRVLFHSAPAVVWLQSQLNCLASLVKKLPPAVQSFISFSSGFEIHNLDRLH